MRYLPHTREDMAQMLQVVGVAGLDDLFSMVPEGCRRHGALDLPEPLTEWELDAHMAALSRESDNALDGDSCPQIFLGAGRYDHFIPESIHYLLGRSEFTTAYTPYQPEMSQGTLQAIYEYQTLTARLLGMEAANASLYDGASALAEGLLMATRITAGKKVAVSRVIHPHYRQVVQTYLRPAGVEILELPWFENGRTDLSGLGNVDVAAVAVQSPNFFGCIEDLAGIGDFCRENGALLLPPLRNPWPTAFSRIRGARAPILPVERVRAWVFPSGSGAREWGCLPASQSICAICPDVWWGKPGTNRVGGDLC